MDLETQIFIGLLGYFDMRYYKQIKDNYIASIGTGYDGEEISEQDYNEIMSVIQSCPNENGKGYFLRTDLTWEEYDLPPVVLSDDDELFASEALDILLGGAV